MDFSGAAAEVLDEPYSRLTRLSRVAALIKKKIKFSSYIKKFRVDHLQSHMTDGLLIYGEILRISSYIRKPRKPFLIYNFATAPL
jgi:hypothetical protein